MNPVLTKIWISQLPVDAPAELRADFSNDRHYAVKIGNRLDADSVAQALLNMASMIGRDPTLRRIGNEAVQCPWPDFAGLPIYEGDVIRHPDGMEGTVVFLDSEVDPGDQWRVDYHDGALSRLVLQIGDKGRAVVIRK